MTLNYFCLLCRFDLEIENWGGDVNELEEIPISRNFVGWTEDWEKVKWKVDGFVNKVLFINKYENMCFVLRDSGHMYYIQKEAVVYERRYGWSIYTQCNVPGVKEDEVTIFLADTLIQKTDQAAGIQVLHPELGSQRDKV